MTPRAPSRPAAGVLRAHAPRQQPALRHGRHRHGGAVGVPHAVAVVPGAPARAGRAARARTRTRCSASRIPRSGSCSTACRRRTSTTSSTPSPGISTRAAASMRRLDGRALVGGKFEDHNCSTRARRRRHRALHQMLAPTSWRRAGRSPDVRPHGAAKQDRTAGRQALAGAPRPPLAAALGDDLYACQPVCRAMLEPAATSANPATRPSTPRRHPHARRTAPARSAASTAPPTCCASTGSRSSAPNPTAPSPTAAPSPSTFAELADCADRERDLQRPQAARLRSATAGRRRARRPQPARLRPAHRQLAETLWQQARQRLGTLPPVRAPAHRHRIPGVHLVDRAHDPAPADLRRLPDFPASPPQPINPPQTNESSTVTRKTKMRTAAALRRSTTRPPPPRSSGSCTCSDVNHAHPMHLRYRIVARFGGQAHGHSHAPKKPGLIP